jgi:hypothetical protein
MPTLQIDAPLRDLKAIADELDMMVIEGLISDGFTLEYQEDEDDLEI